MRTDQAECFYLEAPPPSAESAENDTTKSAVSLKDDDAEPKKPEASNASSDNSKIIPEKKPLNIIPEQILKVAEATKQESNDEKIEEQNAAESAKEENSELPKEAEKTA